MYDVGVIIGEVLAFYLIYLPFALIFKHKVGLIVTTALCITAKNTCIYLYAKAFNVDWHVRGSVGGNAL